MEYERIFHGLDQYELQTFIESVFERRDGNGIQRYGNPFRFAHGGTHLRIVYTSELPVPATIGTRDYFNDTDTLTFALPPGRNREARIPLTGAPWWNPSRNTIVVNIFGLGARTPSLHTMTLEGETGLLGRLMIYKGHLRTGELFDNFSIRELSGYRVADVSLSVILGLSLVTVASIAAWRKRERGALRTVAMLCLSALLLYHARFSGNMLSRTAHDVREWEREGTYGYARDLYRIADDVRESMPEVLRGGITVCGDYATPLRYLLFPAPVRPIQDMHGGGSGAATAILLSPWEERAGGTVYCGERSFSGSILETFPAGGAVARITPSPPV